MLTMTAPHAAYNRFLVSLSTCCNNNLISKMCFKEFRDVFGGVTVKSCDLTSAQKQLDSFSSLMSLSLNNWREKGVRGVWIKVDITDSHIIPVLVDKGFLFHHTQPNYLMMTNWLPETPSTLPRYAHTMIGVGGLVIDTEDRVLLMRERRGVYLGWKYPGGLSDPGESIFDTATREVLEETGVKALGKAILCFRQIARSQYENVGDIYFVCVMEVVDDTMKAGSTEEAAECRWFTREEIKSLPEQVFRDFHHEILKRYDKWKSSGRAGCHMALCKFTGRDCKMFYVD